MFDWLNIFKFVMKLLRSSVSSREVAVGACLGLFMGFTPLNGPMAILLFVLFMVVKLSRISAVLTLPFFKLFYVLGAARLADGAGTYLLVDLKVLSPFWSWLTGLPILAFLDLNNTLVAGGLAISLVLCVPVYFIAKKVNVMFRQQLKDKAGSVKFFAWVTGFSSKAAAAPKGVVSGLARRLNVQQIAIIAVVLLVVHFGTGLFFTPMATSLIVEKLGEYTPAKVTVEKVRVWPLTLSISADDVRVYDPDKTDQRLVKVDRASMRVSPLALLAKRVVLARVSVSGAQINLEGEPDGSFNIQKLAKAEEKKPGMTMPAVFDIFKKKKDLFSRAYDLLKKRSSKKAVEEEKARMEESKSVVQEVDQLPQGKRVHFKTLGGRYLFEIRDMSINNATVTIKADDGTSVDIDRARIDLKRLVYDPELGTALGRAVVEGGIKKEGEPAGRLEFSYVKSTQKLEPRLVLEARLKDVDIDAVKFVFEDSMPASLSGGKLNLVSSTTVVGESLDSDNRLSLKDTKVAAKGAVSGSFVSMPSLADALNSVNPIDLKFHITGTVDKPDFAGFQESLKGLVGPYLKNVGEQIKSQGAGLLGNILKK